MAVIYKTSDRLKVKIDDLTFVISPLSFSQKSEVNSAILSGGAEGAMEGARLAVKYSLKDVSGLVNLDGSNYELDEISDEVIDDLFNLEHSTKLSQVCLNLISGIPKEFIDPRTGQPLEGVSLVKERKSGRPKK